MFNGILNTGSHLVKNLRIDDYIATLVEETVRNIPRNH